MAAPVEALLVSTKFSDLAVAPQCKPGFHSVLVPTNSFSGGYWDCRSNVAGTGKAIFTVSFFASTLWYYLATLVFEVPVLYALGFRSKKSIIMAALVNFITVFSFHYASSYCSQTGKCNLSQGFNSGFILAEALITCIEAIFYFAVLNKEMTARKIVIATVLANLSSAIIGDAIVNNVLGGFQ